MVLGRWSVCSAASPSLPFGLVLLAKGAAGGVPGSSARAGSRGCLGVLRGFGREHAGYEGVEVVRRWARRLPDRW